jgi:hypothetical protein
MTLEEALRKFGKDAVEKAQRNLGSTRKVRDGRGRMRSRRAVASGRLKKALAFNLNKTKEGWRVSFFARGNASKYAAFVEGGVNGTEVNNGAEFSFKKGKKSIPVDVVKQWMKIKPIRIREYKDGKLGGFTKATPARINSTAFLIARSIHRMGMPPLRYFQEAAEDAIAEWGDVLLQSVGDDVADELGFND